MHIVNNNNIFELTNKGKEAMKERLANNSIPGINVAGITSKLDIIYINLLLFKKEIILIILI